MASWNFAPLGEVCRTGAGGTPLKAVKEYYDNGDIPWLLSGEVSQREIIEATNFITSSGLKNSSARLFPPNTVLVAMYGATAGQVGILRFEASTNQAVCGILPNQIFLPEFLYYYLLHKKEELVAQAAGNAQPNISQIKIKNTMVPLARVPEQRRIVAILDEAFAAIATAEANVEQNLQNARDLFSEHLQAIFSQRSQGWVKKTVRQWVDDKVLAKPQDGNHGEIHPTKADYVDTGVPFIMAADLIDGVVDTEGCRFIAEKQARGLRIGFAKTGDVLLSHKGTIGRVAILDTSDDYVMLTPQVTYYRSLDDRRLFNKFLYFSLLSPVFQKAMARIADAGSTRAYIGITRQLDLEMALPSIDIQRQTAARLNRIYEASSRLAGVYEAKLTSLDELKKSLMHYAFTGQLTANKAADMVEAVA